MIIWINWLGWATVPRKDVPRSTHDPECRELVCHSTAATLVLTTCGVNLCSHPGVGNGLSEPLRGVLAETALTGCIRYPWHLLKPLCQVLIDQVFSDFAAEEQLEVSCSGVPVPLVSWFQCRWW